MIHLISVLFTGYLLCQDVVSETGELCAKITHYQIMFMNTIITGPLFNIVATTLYCHPASPYHVGEVCYDAKGIIYCVLAVIVGVVVLI